MPSSPTFSTPACSEIISPRLANRSGIAASTPPATSAVRKVSVNRSSMAGYPVPTLGWAGRAWSDGACPAPTASARPGVRKRGRARRRARQPFGHRHEQEDQADEREQDLARHVRLPRRRLAADLDHRERGDEECGRQRVEAREEDERDHDQAEGGVEVGAERPPDAEDLHRAAERDEAAACHEGEHRDALDVQAGVLGGARVLAKHPEPEARPRSASSRCGPPGSRRRR